MPIGMLQMMPGGTREHYEQLGEKMFGAPSSQFSADDAPDGLIMHSAGPTPDGWYVYDIWESREHLGRFVNERLMPAAAELGGPAPSEPQIFEVYNLVHVPSATTSG